MYLDELVGATTNMASPIKAEAYLEKALPKASKDKIIYNYAIVYAVNLIIGAFSLVIRAYYSNLLGGSIPGMATPPASGALLLVLSIIFSIISIALSAGFLFFMSRFLEGKGSFMQQFYLQSVASIGLLPVSALITILSLAPLLNCVAFIGAIVLTLYSVYLLYLIMKVSHSLSTTNASIIVVIYAVVVVIIVSLLVMAILNMNLLPALGLANPAMGSV